MRVYENNERIRRGLMNEPWFNASDIANAVKYSFHRKDLIGNGDPNAIRKRDLLIEDLYYTVHARQ